MELRSEFSARPDSELSIYVRQRALDGVDAHEQGGGNLAIPHTGGSQLGHLAFSRCELQWARGPASDPRALGPGATGPHSRAEALERLQRLIKGLSSRAFVASTAMDLAGGQERAP